MENVTTKDGNGITFVDKMGIERIRIHAPSTSKKIPDTANAKQGWILRIHADDKGKKFYDSYGNVVNRNSNDGHIPIQGNPNAIKGD